MPIPTVLPEFRPDQPAAEVNAALKQAVHTMDRARHCAVLWFADVLSRGLYRDLGYATMHIYARKELGFSKTRTGDFMRMARRLDDLPLVKQGLASGKLGYTKAREILKVATPATEKSWVKAATTLPRRKLEQKVARVRKSADRTLHNPGQLSLIPQSGDERHLATEVPVRLTLEMTPEQFARYEALCEKLVKGGHTSDRVEQILAGLQALTHPVGSAPEEAGNPAAVTSPTAVNTVAPVPASGQPNTGTPRGTHFQVFVHQCPDCGRLSVPTSRGDLPLGRADSERILCDARIDDPRLGINRHAIAPSVRRRVLARDGHRCQAPGCTNTRFLEVHHITPRSQGGSNDASNLITLCSACHRHTHRHAFPHSVQTVSGGQNAE